MRDCPTLHKFPEGSTSRDYDIFEELADGTKVWRACVVGMENVELKLSAIYCLTHGEISAMDN